MDDQAQPARPASPAETTSPRWAALWIWTVFFGLNSGLSYSFLGPARDIVQTRTFGPGFRGGSFYPGGLPVGLLEFAVPTSHLVGLLVSVAAWLFLYLYFVVYVLPVVFLGASAAPDDRRVGLACNYLNRTYQLLLIAALARATPDLVLLLAPWLSRLGFQ